MNAPEQTYEKGCLYCCGQINNNDTYLDRNKEWKNDWCMERCHRLWIHFPGSARRPKPKTL